MSDSNRSEFVALVAVASTVVVFLLGLWAGGYHYERHEQQTPQSYRPNLSFLEGRPEGYQAICNAPINETQADLCQQWRAAEAATDSARWTQLQFWLGIAGLAGVVATVIYAVKAFRQTVVQAKAAITANEIAREEQAAWLVVGNPEFVQVQSTSVIVDGVGVTDQHCFGVKVRFSVTNAGNMPATDVRIFYDIVDKLQELQPGEARYLSGSMIPLKDGRALHEIGLQRSFEWARNVRVMGLGRGPFVVGRDVLHVTTELPLIVKIPKEQPVMGGQSEYFVVTASYVSPGIEGRRFAHFAFDVCGEIGGRVLCPPPAIFFASGEGLMLRYAEASYYHQKDAQ